MPSVGTAYVNVRINSKTFGTSLDNMMKRLSKQMEAAGTQLGKDFERGVKKTNFDAAFKPITDAAGKASTAVGNSSDKMGESVRRAGENIYTGSQHGKDGLEDLAGAAKDTDREVGKLGKTASNARRSLSGLGGGGGGGAGLRAAGENGNFLSRTLDDIARKAPSAQKTLTHFYNLAAFGGSVAAGAIGGLSGVAQGLFAVGANAAAAAPAMAAATNGLLSMLQVGGTLAIAMKGVGEAIGAGFKSVSPALDSASKASNGVADAVKAAQDAVEAARRGVADALRGIADARRGVEDARRGLREAFDDAARAADDAARAAEEAARKTIRAEQDLASAQRETLVAQRALNAARKEGLEQLEDIAFTAEDAALAEERAGLSLEDAFAALQAVSELPPDNRARQEAELAFKEADLNLRQARDAREDADRAQREAAKSGVEGTDAMTSARDDLASAQEREADASRDLADARRDEAQVAIDNARSIQDADEAIADAQRGLADAHRGVADAQRNLAEANDELADALARLRDAHKPTTAAASEAATALDAYNDALKKLSPSQREFVERIVGMRDRFHEMRNAIAEPLFKGLLTSLDMLNKKGKDNADIYDVIQKGLRGTSDALGDTAVLFADTAQNEVFQKSFGGAMRSNNTAMRNFGRAGVNLAAAFVQVADAAGPLFIRFSDWVREVTRGWRETSRTKNATGELSKTFQTAGDRVSEFWGLAKQLWRTLRILGSAANDAANGFKSIDSEGRKQKGYIPSLTDSLDSFNDKLGKNPTLVHRFTRALKTMSAVGRALKTISEPFIDLGSDPDVTKAFNIISKSNAFKRLGDTAGDSLPAFAHLVTHLADIVATLSESGSIKQFLKVLNGISKLVSDTLDTLVGWKLTVGDTEISGGKLLGTLGAIYGTVKAFKLVWGLAKFLVAGTLGDLRRFKWSNLKSGANGVVNSISNITSALGRAIRNTVTFGKRFKERLQGKTLTPYDVKPPVADPSDTAGAETAGNKITRAYAEGLREGLTQVEAAMEALEALIRENFVEMGGRLRGNAVTAGRHLMVGLAEGIRTSTSVATGAATTAGAEVIAAMKRAMGEKSPSVLTAQAGRDLMTGLSLGVEEGLAPATTTASAAGTKVGTAVSTGAKVGAAGITTSVGAAAATVTAELAVVDSALVGTQVAMKTTGVVARVSSIGVRAFSGAMALVGGPLGLIMLAIPFLIPVFQKLNDKFKITEKVGHALGVAFGWIWGKIKDLFDWVKQNWPLLLGILTGPIGMAVIAIVKNWDKISKGLKDAWHKITKIWSFVTGWFAKQRKKWSENLHALWDNLFERLRNAVRVIGVVWRVFTTWRDRKKAEFKAALAALWDNLFKRLTDAVGRIFTIWANFMAWRDRKKAEWGKALSDFFAPLTTALSDAWDWITRKWDNMRESISKWPDQINKALKNLFNGMGEGLASGLNWVGRKLNWLIEQINNVTDKFGGPQIDFKFATNWEFQGFASGGPVRGPGGPKGDKIPAWLSDNEHVLTAREVAALGGHRNVQKLRKAALKGDLPTGGLFGSIVSGFKTVGNAIKDGAATAVKWVLGNFVDRLPDNFIGDFVGSMISNAASKFTGWGSEKDEAIARKNRKAGKYDGPPGGWTYPVPKSTLTYNWSGHNPSSALDMGTPTGTGVRALTSGRVAGIYGSASSNSSYGLWMVLSHANGLQTLYGHLSRTVAKTGQTVKPGTLIAISGSSGDVTGAHVHLEITKDWGSAQARSTHSYLAAKGIKYPYAYRAAKGGVFAPSPQGTMTLLAEAGKSERVTPLDNEGFTPAERRIIETLEAKMGGGGGDTFHVHPSEQMDETRLADLVARRVAWKRRRGAGRR